MGQTLNLVSQFGAPTFTSLRVIGNTTLGNNLVVSGSITAQSLIVNSTSVYSGSTKFGEIITNTHQFTGSLFISGSTTVVGQYNGSGAGLTSIPNSALTNSTISGISLGSNLATLTIGTGLSGTSYNGSDAVTIANTGVTSIVAGTGISINQGTGAVTVTNTINNTNQLTNGAGFITSAGNTATSTALSSGQSNWSGTGVLGNVVGLLAWKNYGNSHVIFDASNSTTPSGTACNNTNPSVAWTGTYPTLMGWNGTNTYGVRVDSAKVADSANSVAWTNVSSRPTALSSFTNDLGNYGSWITSAGTAAAINQTVAVDTNANLVYSQMGSNDFFRIRVGGGSNAGYVEIATADDGTEPIYIRQYTGVFTDVTRTATILDGSGNTTFPGALTANSFSGTSYWTNISGRPTALSQLTNDLGNYGNWYSNNGGTISGNVTINGSSNDVLTLNQAQAYINIYSTGASNDGGLKIYPTTGFNAIVGNFRGGELVLYASSTDAVYINSNSIRVNKYRFKSNDTLSGNGTPEIVDKASVGMSMQSLNYHWYNSNAGTLLMELNSSGDTYNLNGTYGTISSDRRLKENIAPATPKLDDIMKLNVVNFNLIGNENKHIGFIAQEIQEVFPSFVHQSDTRKYDEDGNVVSGLEDALGVKIGMEFAILVKAIQEQQAQITQQNELITSLQSRLTAAGL